MPAFLARPTPSFFCLMVTTRDPADQLWRIICRSVIDQNDLNELMALRESAFYRGGKKLCAVVDRNDDADTCATNDQESGNSAQAIERGDAAIGIHGVDETGVSGYSAVGVTAACSPYPDPALF